MSCKIEKSYALSTELFEKSHSEWEILMQETLMIWNEVSHDIQLLSTDGQKIFTNKALLSFYSPSLKEVLNDPVIAFSLPVPSVSLPATSSCVSMLLKILVEGKALASDECSLEQVTNLAIILGIKLHNIILMIATT